MKILISSIILFVALFIVGCATGPVVVKKEYRGHKVTGKRLAVVKLFENATILNPDDVADDLGTGVPDEVYNTFFDENFISEIQHYWCCNEALVVGKDRISSLEERKFEINNDDTLKILLPKDNTKIEIDSISADFILFVDEPFFFRKAPSYVETRINPLYSASERLFQTLNFAIWDNNIGRIVSYGVITEESTFFLAMSKGDWESVLSKIAKKIVYFSPFALSKSVHFN